MKKDTRFSDMIKTIMLEGFIHEFYKENGKDPVVFEVDAITTCEIMVYTADDNVYLYNHDSKKYIDIVRYAPAEFLEDRKLWQENFAIRLERFMKNRAWDVKELSDRANVSQTAIRAYLNCTAAPTLYNAYRLSIAFGMSLDSLVKCR